MPGFLWTLLHVPFPFADFPWYPFTIIHCNHEYDYMLSPMGLSGESLPLGIVLRTPDTHIFLFHVIHLETEVRMNKRVGLNAKSKKK